MTDPPSSLVALRQRRERVIELLCEHFAQDHLETQELEQLLDRAHQATSLAQLDELLSGLPQLSAPLAPEAAKPPARAREVRDQQLVVAIMGGVERKGGWSPARQNHVIAIMGGVCLDFRSVSLASGVTEVNVLAVMGGVEIIVPPGIHVESNGIGIMGGFEHSGRGRLPVDGSVPVLRITGLALMGGVEIREAAPGALPPGGTERLVGGRRRTLS